MKDRDTRGAAPDFDERDSQLFLIVAEHRVRGRQRLEHEIGNPVAGALHALAKILRRRRLHRDEIHLHLEPGAGHADGI